MGFSAWDVVDFIPIIGTVARLGESVVLVAQGRSEDALESLKNAGMNVAGDALGLATGGVGKFAVSGGRVATKLLVSGSRAAGEVAEGGAVHAATRATEKVTMSEAQSLAWELQQKEARAAVEASRRAADAQYAVGKSDRIQAQTALNSIREKMAESLTREQMAKTAKGLATTTLYGSGANFGAQILLQSVTPESKILTETLGDDTQLKEGVDPSLLVLEGRPEMHLDPRHRAHTRRRHNETPPQLSVGKDIHYTDEIPPAIILLGAGIVGVATIYLVSE